MSEQNQGTVPPAKKMLESSPLSGISVPIAIVLIGALIIFGVTKMLSTGTTHRDLIEEIKPVVAEIPQLTTFEITTAL